MIIGINLKMETKTEIKTICNWLKKQSLHSVIRNWIKAKYMKHYSEIGAYSIGILLYFLFALIIVNFIISLFQLF